MQRSLCDPVQPAQAQRDNGMWEERGAFRLLCTELAKVLWNHFGASGDKLLAQMSPLSQWALPWRCFLIRVQSTGHMDVPTGPQGSPR